MKKIFAALAALFFTTAAYGQGSGTAALNAFAIGKGPNISGFTSLLCGAGQLAVGSAAAPVCRTVSGDASFSALGVLTFNTVNANVGSFGSATNCVTFTVNGKGLITAASQTACSTNAGGSAGQIQYNNAGVLDGFTASGDFTLDTGTGVATFATVNADVGSFGSATNCTTFTVNAKGLVTAASQATCTPAVGSITGLGTGVSAALAQNVGAAGAFVTFNGAGGTPSSLVLTNATGLPVSGLANAGALTLLGRSANSAGPYADIAAVAASDCVYRESGSTLGCGTVAAAGIASGAVTVPKLATETYDPGSIANCRLSTSVASNNLTISLLTQSGATPSATSPCVVSFRNVTADTGDYTPVSVTAATTVVFNSGSSFGAPSSSTPFRIWVTAWNNAGTVVLGASNQTAASGVAPINEAAVQSSTACSACATATAAQTFYTTAAQTSKAIRILGYAEWGTGLATAGTWASAATTVQMFGPGVYKPGERVRKIFQATTTATTSTSSSFAATGLAQNFTMASAANVLSMRTDGDTINNEAGGNSGIQLRFYRGSAACTTQTGNTSRILIPANFIVKTTHATQEVPFASATTTAQYTVCLASPNAPNSVSYPWGSNGTASFEIEEIMG